MLVSKERAEHIAELAYKLYEKDNSQEFITYQKVTELDKNTADKMLIQIASRLKAVEMKEFANQFGSKIYFADDEIVEVDNYQYVDSIDYDVLTSGLKKEIMSINCKLYNGDTFSIESSNAFYGPNVYYPGLFGLSYDSDPLFKNMKHIELYLKLLIVEDRLINPYYIQKKSNGFQRIVVGMKEKIDGFKKFDKEIDILNEMFKVLDGKLISFGILNQFADINIKATVLYLETLGEIALANKLRRYQNDPIRLNIVLESAMKGYSGLVFQGRNFKVGLL